MHRVFLADTDKESILGLSCLLKENHKVLAAVWQNRGSYNSFIEAPGSGAVFIRIDDPAIPGLELTRYASDHHPRIHIVWMAKSKSYALEAFPRGVDAYLLHPVTPERLREIMDSLEIAEARK